MLRSIGRLRTTAVNVSCLYSRLPDQLFLVPLPLPVLPDNFGLFLRLQSVTQTVFLLSPNIPPLYCSFWKKDPLGERSNSWGNLWRFDEVQNECILLTWTWTMPKDPTPQTHEGGRLLLGSGWEWQSLSLFQVWEFINDWFMCTEAASATSSLRIFAARDCSWGNYLVS